MRISDWSSDVCSSDLLITTVRPESTIDRAVLGRHPGHRRESQRRAVGTFVAATHAGQLQWMAGAAEFQREGLGGDDGVAIVLAPDFGVADLASAQQDSHPSGLRNGVWWSRLAGVS